VSGLACGAERALKHCFVKVVAPELAVGSAVAASCREDPLPRPFALRKRVLVSECARKLDVTRASLEIRSMRAPYAFEVGVQKALAGS
jgi:hypothetical protein